MSKLPLIARILLGLVFFVFGLMGLLNLIPPPPPEQMSEQMRTFFAGIMAAKYFFPLLKGTEVVCGALLLSGYFVPLALVVLAPIVLNILGVHVFIDPKGLPIALVIVVLEAYLAFFARPYRDKVLALFRAK